MTLINDSAIEAATKALRDAEKSHDGSKPWIHHAVSEVISAYFAALSVEQDPVAKQWCAYENGEQQTSWVLDGYGDQAGWAALAKRNPEKYQIVTRALYAHPPTPVSSPARDEEIERLKVDETIISDTIRSAYDCGYNDARNAYNTVRDNAKGYRGRDKSEEISSDLLARLRRLSDRSSGDAVRVTDEMITAGARAAFEIDWPKDNWERLGPGYHQDRYRNMIKAAIRSALVTADRTEDGRD